MFLGFHGPIIGLAEGMFGVAYELRDYVRGFCHRGTVLSLGYVQLEQCHEGYRLESAGPISSRHYQFRVHCTLMDLSTDRQFKKSLALFTQRVAWSAGFSRENTGIARAAS